MRKGIRGQAARSSGRSKRRSRKRKRAREKHRANVYRNGLRWADAVFMQAHRLRTALSEYEAALDDTRMRDLLAHSDDDRWWAHYEKLPMFDPERPIRAMTWRLGWQCSNEHDLLLVAASNLHRAVKRLPDPSLSEARSGRIAKLLRNISEHYDELGGWSRENLSQDFPDVEVGLTAYTGKEVWIGGFEGVTINDLCQWAESARDLLQAALASLTGDSAPEALDGLDTDSLELPFPPERVFWSWQVGSEHASAWPSNRLELDERGIAYPPNEID